MCGVALNVCAMACSHVDAAGRDAFRRVGTEAPEEYTMNSEQSVRNARNQWNGRALGILALGIVLSAIPTLAQQDPQNSPDHSNPPATAPANFPQTQQDQTMPPQQDQQAQQDQQQQDQTAPPQQNQQGQVQQNDQQQDQQAAPPPLPDQTGPLPPAPSPQ